MSLKKVLITGAYGLIGNVVYGRLSASPERYEVCGLAHRPGPSRRLVEEQVHHIPPDRFVLADLTDWDAMQRAVDGMDVVVHMAADASGAFGWESILQNNIVGSYHVFEASRLAGAGRIVFASTIQVIHGYEADEPYGAIRDRRVVDLPEAIPPVTHEMPPRPLNLYASSKVWGESLCHVYAEQHGLSCIALRIGWVLVEDRPRWNRLGGDWCSQRDIAQIVQRCVDAPESVRYDIFFGVSDNRYRFVDIAHARDVLGYVPQDCAEDHIEDTAGGAPGSS